MRARCPGSSRPGELSWVSAVDRTFAFADARAAAEVVEDTFGVPWPLMLLSVAIAVITFWPHRARRRLDTEPEPQPMLTSAQRND